MATNAASYTNTLFRNNALRYDTRSFQHEHKYSLYNGSSVSSRNDNIARLTNGNNKVLTTTHMHSSSSSYKKHLVSSLRKTNIKTLSSHDVLLYNNYLNDISNNTKHKVNITLNILNTFIPNYDNAKHSTVHTSPSNITAYGANTYQGIIRNYNEDRVSIIFNMKPPSSLPPNTQWPKVTFFAIYDGHGGSSCSDFLRDHLHTLICYSECFLSNVQQAIYEGFAKAEEMFINNEYKVRKDKSGSCALVAIIVNDKLYVANCGDSRAVMSMKDGKEWKDITVDHKPNEEHEKKRIEMNGGSVYQSQIALLKGKIMGPYRVIPGRLSVSRTIGDGNAKEEKKGVIIARPDVYECELKEKDVDFVVMACDGVFDQMSSKEVVDCAWMVFNKGNEDVHDKCGKVVDLIMKSAMVRKSMDNVTCIIIAMKNIGKESNCAVTKDETYKVNNVHGNYNKASIGDNKILYTNYSSLSNAKGMNLSSAQTNSHSNVAICNYNRNSIYPLSTLNKNSHNTINTNSRGLMMYNKYTNSHSLKHNYKPPSAVKLHYDRNNSNNNSNSNSNIIYNSYNNTLCNTLDNNISLNKKKHDLHLNSDSLNSFSVKNDRNVINITPTLTPSATINANYSYKYSYNPNINYHSNYLYSSNQTPLTQRYHSAIQRYNSTITHSSTIRLNTDRYNNYFI